MISNIDEINGTEIAGNLSTDLETLGRAIKHDLKKQGDNGTSKRKIFHMLSGISTLDSDGDCTVANRLLDLGFAVSFLESDAALRVFHFGEVASGNVDKVAYLISKIAREEGWFYQGWECEVIEAETGEAMGMTGTNLQLYI